MKADFDTAPSVKAVSSADKDRTAHSLTTVGVIVTRSCPIECRMCITSSGPDVREWMSWETVEDLIGQASRIPSVKSLAITGGEPFARFRFLRKIVATAGRQGLDTSVTTNAYWAVDEHATQRRLQQLQDAGLRSITVSTDLFHQEFLPVSRAELAAECAQRVGLEVTLNRVVQARDSGTFLGMPSLPSGATVVESGFVPAGRATNLPCQDRPPAKSASEVSGPCRDARGSLTVDVEGDVYSCCGLLTSPFVVGQFPSSTLTQLADAAEDNSVTRALATIGPVAVADVLGRSVTGAQSQCDVCLQCFGHGAGGHGDLTDIERLRIELATRYVEGRRQHADRIGATPTS